MGILLAILAAAFFAITAIFMRRAVSDAPNEQVVVWVLGLNSFLLGGATLVELSLGARLTVSAPAAVAFAATGVVGHFFARAMLVAAIRHMGGARAVTLKVAHPVVTMVLAGLFLQERVTAAQAVGLGLVLLGIYALSQEAIRREGRGVSSRDGAVEVRKPAQACQSEPLRVVDEAGPAGLQVAAAAAKVKGGASLLGLAYGLAAAAGFGAGNVLRKTGMNLLPAPLAGSALSSVSGLVAILIYCLVRGSYRSLLILKGQSRLAIPLAGASSSLAVLCFTASFGLTKATITATLAATEPFFVVLFSWFLGYREQIGSKAMLAMGTVVVGVGVLAMV